MGPLIFSINAVMPLVTLTALGYILRRVNIISTGWAAAANKLCYRTFLPVLLFMNIYGAESLTDVNWEMTLFSAIGLILAYILGWFGTRLFSIGGRQKGVIVQAAFRSNFAILGMPLAISLFGPEGGQSVAVLSIFTIPAFNIMSVIALRGHKDEFVGPAIKGMIKDIVRNPLVISVFLGFLALAIRWTGVSFRLSNISFLFSAATSLSQVASPLMLVCLGAQFNFSATHGLLKPLAVGVISRNILVPLVTLSTAYLFFPGFYGAGFAALISLFASPMAVSAAVMAIEMGGDAELAGQCLFWSTILSAVTIFLFVFVFRTLGALG